MYFKMVYRSSFGFQEFSKLALILTTVSNSPEFLPLDAQSFKFKRIHGLNVRNLI